MRCESWTRTNNHNSGINIPEMKCLGKITRADNRNIESNRTENQEGRQFKKENLAC